MRFLYRTRYGEPAPHRAIIAIVAVLGGLAVLGAMVNKPKAKATASVPASGTIERKATYASLPGMTISLAGAEGRSVDLRVTLEMAPSADPKLAEPAFPRIADRLGDRLREVEAVALQGAEGAKLVKNAVAIAVSQEIGTGKIRNVLLESMVVR